MASVESGAWSRPSKCGGLRRNGSSTAPLHLRVTAPTPNRSWTVCHHNQSTPMPPTGIKHAVSDSTLLHTQRPHRTGTPPLGVPRSCTSRAPAPGRRSIDTDNHLGSEHAARHPDIPPPARRGAAARGHAGPHGGPWYVRRWVSRSIDRSVGRSIELLLCWLWAGRVEKSAGHRTHHLRT